jgi:mevalonate pyrophosphate decarboxylase
MHATADTTAVIYISGSGRRVMRGVRQLRFMQETSF